MNRLKRVVPLIPPQPSDDGKRKFIVDVWGNDGFHNRAWVKSDCIETAINEATALLGQQTIERFTRVHAQESEIR